MFEDANEATGTMLEQASLFDESDEEPTVGDWGGEAPDDEPEQGAEQQADQGQAYPEPEQAPVQGMPQVQQPQVPGYEQEMEQLRAQLSQAQEQSNAIIEQNAQLQNMVRELSEKNKENIIEDAVEMPILDIDGLSFADDETIRRAQTDYAEKMAAYARNSVMEELQPFIEEAKAGKAKKEKEYIVESLKRSVPDMADIDDMLPIMDRIMSQNAVFSGDSVPLDERMIAAYAMARGINAINAGPQKDPTTEDLMDYYHNNADFQKAIEQERLAAVRGSQQVPPFSASSGAVNAALNIEEKPKTIREASEMVARDFGRRKN